ncbi:hypothetical protein JL722_8718 [Aureococcus anophagefferens]|nr:hypothetical protein JL722_8718 [Aureococcus anophagefferens]
MPAMEEEDMEAAYETAAREAGERGPKKATSFLDDISSDDGDGDDDDREQTDRYKAALKKREKAAKLKAEKEARERERRAREADATAARRAVDASARRKRLEKEAAAEAAEARSAALRAAAENAKVATCRNCSATSSRRTRVGALRRRLGRDLQDGLLAERRAADARRRRRLPLRGPRGLRGVMLKTLEKWTRGDAWHGEGKLDKRVEKCKRPPSVAKPKPSKKASKKGGPRAPAKAPAAKPRTESIADDASSSVWATSPEAEGRKVLVLGLASTAAEDDLFDYFATFGTVEAVGVAADLNTGATVGYVTMATWQEAAAILDRGAVVGGVSLEVVLAAR